MTTTFVSQAPPAVSVHNVSYQYDREPLLHDISFSLAHGESLAIIGPNGGGKTTLIRLLLGFLSPQQGSINIYGSPPTKTHLYTGYVPQFSAMQQNFPASVLQLVLMGQAKPSWNGGIWHSNKNAKIKALQLLELLGLQDHAQTPIGALSGGQRQRALIARALMGKKDDPKLPFLLLLDEPTASIDPYGKHCFYDFLESLRGSCTIIAVSHDLFMASPYFSSVALVDKTLTMLSPDALSPEGLASLFGTHAPSCPVGFVQQALGKMYEEEHRE